MIILGIGGVLGDAAAALLKDGELVAAVEESKLARHGRTHTGLPEESIAMCLELAGVGPDQVDCVSVVRPIPAAQSSSLSLAGPRRPRASRRDDWGRGRVLRHPWPRL